MGVVRVARLPAGRAGTVDRVTSTRPGLLEHVRNSWRILLKEVASFGAVGLIGFVIQLGLFNLLHDIGVLKANAVAMAVATAFAYVGNRYLSFSHRARTSIGRETAFFFGINLVTLAFSLLIIALFVYPLGFGHASLTVKVVNVGTIALGTLFRFWAYKRFVFLHPDRVHQPDVNLDEELAE